MSEVVGPHVIEKTDEVIYVHDHINDFHGERAKWRCKYCGETGTHPDKGGSMAWKRDCDEFAVLESEAEAIDARGGA